MYKNEHDFFLLIVWPPESFPLFPPQEQPCMWSFIDGTIMPCWSGKNQENCVLTTCMLGETVGRQVNRPDIFMRAHMSHVYIK